MKDLHLLKAAQAMPFVETLTRMGAPIDLLSRSAGLPLEDVREGRGVIGERSLWRLVELAAELDGMELLGYRVALEHPVTSTGELGGLRMRRAPNLERLLEYFIEDVGAESTGARFRLLRDEEGGWICRWQMYPGSAASWQAEQYVVGFLIQIVRLCAGPDWLPSTIRICSRSTPCALPAEWASVEFEWGGSTTEVRLEAATLALPPRGDRPLEPRSPEDRPNPLPTIASLVDRLIWSSTTSIENAAYELGLSVSTLKRRLSENQTSFSEILEQRRKRWAQHLLTRTDLPIKDVARALGYRHAANFTRAFGRMCGTSPSRFRHGARLS
jgi:AraC-like DNA-binding protein